MNAAKFDTDSEVEVRHINENLFRLENKIEKGFSDMEKKLEKFDGRLWSNFYWILSTMFTLSCAGAAVLAKGFGWFN